MADITKCPGTNCTRKENCHRFTAEDSYWQSYSDFFNYVDKRGICSNFWDNGKEVKNEQKTVSKRRMDRSGVSAKRRKSPAKTAK